MRLIFSERVWEDYLYWQQTDPRTLRRINALIRANKDEIEKILRDYHLPMLNARGELMQ